MRLLVVAAHADDETLGAGGTIARWVGEGAEARLVVATTAHEPDWSAGVIAEKQRELLAAAHELGVSSVEVLGMPAAQLDMIPRRTLNDALAHEISLFQPEVLLAPHYGDVHLDHQIVFEAVMVAARPRPGSSVRQLLAFETPSSSEWAAAVPARAFSATFYVDISGTLDAKVRALSQYASELRDPPHPRSIESVRNLAVRRGMEVGIPAAEAFQLIRQVG